MDISEEEKMNPCTEITKVGQPYHSNSFTLKGKGNSTKNYLRTVGIGVGKKRIRVFGS